ncbi:hypothetical protein ACFZDK_55790, partial [Streptomyces sp. NPDC007901]
STANASKAPPHYPTPRTSPPADRLHHDEGHHPAFQYLSSYTWGRVIFWLRRKHPGLNWKQLRRRFCGGGWWPASEERELFNPAKVRTTRYRYRGSVIPSPWQVTA